uniref:RNase H family protein n=1 Tax=Solanum tuberosum TaxID=4113 RepID=M0ZK88_SOLTU
MDSRRRTNSFRWLETLLDGLKELCANGWRGDNGTFRPGHLMELERYIHKYHPRSGLKSEPHIKNKMRYWKRCYGSIALLKTRSGLGFQYSDGTIIVDDPKHWIDFIKIDPQAKKMNTKKWPLFKDWEEIFGKDRATGEFVEGPLDATEEIQKSQAPQHSNDMSLGFLIDVDLDDDEEEEENAYHSSKIGTKLKMSLDKMNLLQLKVSPNIVHLLELKMSLDLAYLMKEKNVTGSENEHAGSQKSHKQGEYSKRSSSNVNEKEKSKKRKKIVEDDSETFLKGMMEVMKNFTESQDKRIGSLIEKMGDRDRSDVRGQVYSILESPVFELYTTEQRIKAAMILCKDDKKMELFLRMGEHDRQTMMWMVVHDKL